MIVAAAALILAGCRQPSLTLEQAKQLVLSTPNIRAAVRERGARPRFEWIDFGPNDAAGGAGAPVSSDEIRRLQRLYRGRC